MPIKLPTKWITHQARSEMGWRLIRWTLALLIAAHGWARLLAGAVAPFGEFLETLGFPMGHAIASAVTFVEIVGSVALLLGLWVPAVCILHVLIYAAGIVLVHAQSGWFVVGLGRNGAEYSVMLIVCLVCVGWQRLER